MKKLSGFKHVCDVPNVLISSRIDAISDVMGKCTGCESVLHYINIATAICPKCIILGSHV